MRASSAERNCGGAHACVIVAALALYGMLAAAGEPSPAPMVAAGSSAPGAGSGVLVVDVKPFESEIQLKEKVQRQLASGGLEWGQQGDRVVFSMVNKRYLSFDLQYLTRYGEQRRLELPAGEYHVTGIGFIIKTAFSPEKMLSKGAFFNEDILRLHVEPGRTTTLTIRPMIRKQSTMFLKFFVPELLAHVTIDGPVTTGIGGGESGAESTAADISLNAELPTSVRWDDYHGDLKFVPSSAATGAAEGAQGSRK